MTLVKVSNLVEGDLVDLENDPYADPDGGNVSFRYEYVEVGTVEIETPTCVAVGFEGWDVCGFPVNHLVKVKTD